MESAKFKFLQSMARGHTLNKARLKAGISCVTAYHYKMATTTSWKPYQHASPVLTDNMKRKLLYYSFRNHPDHSFREVAQKHDISEATVHQFAKSKGFKSITRREVPLETASIVARCKSEGQLCLKSTQKRQSISSIKNPQKDMVLGVIREDGGNSPPIFVPEGETLKAAGYIKLLKRVKTWADSWYGVGKYIFTQDGARPHTANVTLAWLEENMPGFWGPEKWPPNSPQINPLDKAIWVYLQNQVNSTSHSNIKSLKAAIMKHWKLMPESVKKWCTHFWRDLESLKNNNGVFTKEM